MRPECYYYYGVTSHHVRLGPNYEYDLGLFEDRSVFMFYIVLVVSAAASVDGDQWQ